MRFGQSVILLLIVALTASATVRRPYENNSAREQISPRLFNISASGGPVTLIFLPQTQVAFDSARLTRWPPIEASRSKG